MRYRLNDMISHFRTPVGRMQLAYGIRCTLNDTRALLATPLGRMQFVYGARRRAWPVLGPMAGLYRKTLVRDTRLVSVVGSLGKTTTMRAVTCALGMKAHRNAHRNAWSELGFSILRIRPGNHHAVIEVGIDKPGQMAMYANMVRPDITVVTSVASEHNRSFGTLEVTRAEKSQMVRILPSSGIAILNGDDPNVRWMEDKTKARVITFGTDEANDVRASDVVIDWPRGTKLRLHINGAVRDLCVRMMGKQMIYPILAATAVAWAEGIDLDRIVAQLESLKPTPGRLETIRLPSGAFLLGDYEKAALESIEAALDVFSEIPAKRRIVVLGEVSEPPGSQGPIYRHIGERIAQVASKAILVCGRKSFKSYAVGATRSGFAPEALVHIGEDIRNAIEALKSNLGPGDVVLVKGRDTQAMGRIALALEGRAVRCNIGYCDARAVQCSTCPMLERGWEGLRVMI